MDAQERPVSVLHSFCSTPVSQGAGKTIHTPNSTSNDVHLSKITSPNIRQKQAYQVKKHPFANYQKPLTPAFVQS